VGISARRQINATTDPFVEEHGFACILAVFEMMGSQAPLLARMISSVIHRDIYHTVNCVPVQSLGVTVSARKDYPGRTNCSNILERLTRIGLDNSAPVREEGRRPWS
jgi:hypothetical protein